MRVLQNVTSECVRFDSEFSGTEMDHKVETGKVFVPSCLSCVRILVIEIMQILVISDHIDQKSRAFEVMSPSFESFKNREEFFVMHIIVEFKSRKSPGVESNRVQFTIGSHDGKDSGECIFRGISLNCYLGFWIQWVRTRAVVKAFFKCFKGRMALIGEMARVPCG